MVIRCCKKCAYEVSRGSQASLDSFVGPCRNGHDFPNDDLASQEKRVSINTSLSVYVLGVKDETALDGLDLSGNAVSITKKHIVTAFHNIYDEQDFQNEEIKMSSSDEYVYMDAFNFDLQKKVVLKIFKFSVISQYITKYGVNNKTEEYRSPILVQFLQGNYEEDWAVLKVVSGKSSYCGLDVLEDPDDLKFWSICPERKIPKDNDTTTTTATGYYSFKGYHFDIALYKHSQDREEILTCQRVDYSPVILFKPKSKILRMQGSLSNGSCGSPSVSEEGELVAIHIASLDSTMSREPRVRFHSKINNKKRKKTKLNLTNLEEISRQKFDVLDKQVNEIQEDQDKMSEHLSSFAETYTSYKEAFVLCLSEEFMRLYENIQRE